MKLTRRKLAAVLAAPAAAVAAQAQPQGAPVDEVEAARQRIRSNAEALAKVDVPTQVEPAFAFKA